MQQIEPYSSYPALPGVPQSQPLPLTYYTAPSDESEEFNLKQFLSIVQRRAGLITGVAVVVTGIFWATTLTRPKIYQSSFQVLVEPITNSAIDNEKAGLLSQSEAKFDYATQIEVLRSPSFLAPTIKSLQATYPDLNYSQLVQSLQIAQVATAAKGGGTKILSVSYQNPDPKKVKVVLDQLAKDYIAYSLQVRQSSLQQGVQFVEGQLPELKKRVELLQGQLERFRQRYSLIDPASRGGDLAQQISELEQERREALIKLKEAQALYNALEKQLGVAPGQALTASTLSGSPAYQEILSQIKAVEAQLAVESVRFQADSPNIQVLREKRESLVSLLNQESQRIVGNSRASENTTLAGMSLGLGQQLVETANQIQVLQLRNQALAQAERRLKQEFALVPALSRQYTELQRELGVATSSLDRFLATRETLELEAAQKALPWQLLSNPTQGVLTALNTTRNLVLGIFAGLLLGIGAALIAEKLDNVFHSANELKDSTRLPLLGIIPYRKDLKELAPISNTPLPSQANAHLALEAQSDSPGLELPSAVSSGSSFNPSYNASPFVDAFRSIHTNIRFLGSDEPIRSLVVGSAVPADGKSTVSINLAQAAAAMGQRVLLVDADLRRPQLHLRLNLTNFRGLTNLISAELDAKDVIQQSLLDDNFFILTAGQIPPDPTKLLASKKMQRLMDQFSEMFDLVIYDTPPLLGLADSSIVAAHTNGLILVVGLGRTDRSLLKQALEGLKISSTTVLGIIANGVEGYTSSDYYQAYYNRYYTQKGA
ncbi:MAG: polysaccharide biosynthesis tyrosine autokinase [Leptolyngbyaceae bacterium]|nr:polysaccharide biosynthesis tyrosine autokinase [Leptolyngbyaceae bacterium]